MAEDLDTRDDPLWSIAERRAGERVAGWANAKVRLDFKTILPATVADLSRAGCRLRTSRAVQVGAFIQLKIGDICIIQAEIVWARDGWHGCRFAAPIGQAALGRFRERWAEDADEPA